LYGRAAGLKMLCKMLSSTFFDGQGYWLAQKRLSKGKFVWWPESEAPAKPLEAYEAPSFYCCPGEKKPRSVLP
jgi:hypothetical protein